MGAPARIDVYAPIVKRERDPETGFLYVYGKMTGSNLDNDEQRMDPEFLRKAVPAWFRQGNIREMHQSKAAGKALQLDERDDGWYVGAKIVDKDTALKIDEGVLTGFSIGIKGPRIDYSKADAPNGVITDGRICETSVVDAPCLSDCTFTEVIAKADSAGELRLTPDDEEGSSVDPPADDTAVKDEEPDLAKYEAAWMAKYSAAELRDMLTHGQAYRNAAGKPSYPTKTKSDLRKAIRAVGRGGSDHDSIRKYIIGRAKSMGLSDMIPDNWNSDGSLKKVDGAWEMPAEWRETAERVKAEVAELVKADDSGGESAEGEASDIASAKEAIACIANLIISEAKSLAAGNCDEAYDISCLMEAVSSLKYFIMREEMEQEAMEAEPAAAVAKADTPDEPAPPAEQQQTEETEPPAVAEEAPPAEEVTKADTPAEEVTKADTPDDADDDDEGDSPEVVAARAKAKQAKKALKAAKKAAKAAKAGQDAKEAAADVNEEGDGSMGKTETPEVEKTDGAAVADTPDVAALVKAELAEVQKRHEEQIAALKADIERLADMPEPGGPALTRTADQASVARKADAAALKIRANSYLAKAEIASDPTLRLGYEQLARDLNEKAEAMA